MHTNCSLTVKRAQSAIYTPVITRAAGDENQLHRLCAALRQRATATDAISVFDVFSAPRPQRIKYNSLIYQITLEIKDALKVAPWHPAVKQQKAIICARRHSRSDQTTTAGDS